MAEVLVTLGIIGVVAALTMPSLIQHHRKQVTATKLKKAYSVLSQAYLRSVDENGDFSQVVFNGTNAGKEFYEYYWKKYLNTVSECGSQRAFYPEGLSPWYQPDGRNEGTGAYCNPRTRWIATLSDGILLLFLIRTETATPENKKAIFVDINGIEKPNTFGKDVFVFIYDEKGVKSEDNDLSDSDAKSQCKTTGRACSTLIYRNGWEIPKDYPVKI